MEIVKTQDYVAVRHSQWGYKGTAYGCMNCGFGVIAPIYNYCPNCGALMSDEVAGKVAPDSVVVVRCRDCKEWEPCNEGECGTCNLIGGLWEPHEYCSEGERRDDDAADRR